jgi:hypothetical protein
MKSPRKKAEDYKKAIEQRNLQSSKEHIELINSFKGSNQTETKKYNKFINKSTII